MKDFGFEYRQNIAKNGTPWHSNDLDAAGQACAWNRKLMDHSKMIIERVWLAGYLCGLEDGTKKGEL